MNLLIMNLYDCLVSCPISFVSWVWTSWISSAPVLSSNWFHAGPDRIFMNFQPLIPVGLVNWFSGRVNWSASSSQWVCWFPFQCFPVTKNGTNNVNPIDEFETHRKTNGSILDCCNIWLCVFWGNVALLLVILPEVGFFYMFTQNVTDMSGTKNSQKNLEKIRYQWQSWYFAQPYYRKKPSLFS